MTFDSAPNYEVKSRYPPAGSSTESYSKSQMELIDISYVDVNDAPNSIQENTNQLELLSPLIDSYKYKFPDFNVDPPDKFSYRDH